MMINKISENFPVYIYIYFFQFTRNVKSFPMNFKNPIIAKSSRWKMVTSSQLGNLVVTYTLYLMKRTGRNSSQRFINGSNSAKERPGESKKKKKEQKIFDRPVFRSDRSINLEEEERACYRSIASPN